MTETLIRTDTIRCPECGRVQEAAVTVFDALPVHPVMVHHCAGCAYIIMESNWERVTEAGDAQRPLGEGAG